MSLPQFHLYESIGGVDYLNKILPTVGFDWKKISSGNTMFNDTAVYAMQFDSIAARWHERGDMSLLQPAMYCPCYFAFVIQIVMMLADAGKREQELLFRAGAKSIASGSQGAKLLAGVEQTESETT